MVKKILEFFVLLHNLGFYLVQDTPMWYQKGNLSLTFGTAILGVILILLSITADGFIIYGVFRLPRIVIIKLLTKHVSSRKVAGEVVNKYVKGRKYCVYVQYKKFTKLFIDKNLYHHYQEGEQIPLVLTRKIDRHGSVIEWRLELPKN